MKKLDVISIGAVLLDLIGRVDRLPFAGEEAFVESLVVEPGGSAANTAVACTRLGLSAGFIGAVGRDHLGSVLRRGLVEEGIDVSQVRVRDAPTGICAIFIDKRGSRAMYAFSGAANLLQPDDIDSGYLTSAKHVHLADLKNIASLIRASKLARDGGVPVSLNVGGLIAGLNYSIVAKLLSNVDILILSEDDAERLFGSREIDRIASKALEAGVSLIALTLGSRGSVLATAKERVQLPAYSVRLVDDTGASDAFSAGLIYGLLRDLSLEDCARYANAAAALCVSTLGARFKHELRDVERLIKQERSPRKGSSLKE